MQPDTVVRLWNYMCAKYGTTVVAKRSAWEMRAAGTFLGALGIQPAETFLGQYVTTVGSKIYVPFIVGVASEGWSMVGQAAVCAHEHEHVIQSRRDGWLYTWRYLTSTAWRARYEIEAYRATMELQWALTGEIDPERYAIGLRAYGCTAADVVRASATLMMYADDIRSGRMVSQAAVDALRFINSAE